VTFGTETRPEAHDKLKETMAMFGFIKKVKPHSVLDEFIFAVYGNPPPPKRADINEATRLAFEELLMGNIDDSVVRQHAVELASGPIPYSTHDLALSVALNFFKQTEYMERLNTAQLLARLKVAKWLQAGLVVPVLVKSFEEVLYKLYRP
jgi:hypothetical protein